MPVEKSKINPALVHNPVGTYTGPVIDCCFHIDWSDQSEVLEYLPKGWQAYLGIGSVLTGKARDAVAAREATAEATAGDALRSPEASPDLERTSDDGRQLLGGYSKKSIELEQIYVHPDGPSRAEFRPSTGGRAGSTPEALDFFRNQQLEAAVLYPSSGMMIPADNNVTLGAALCRAVNDWTADRWLDGEDRKLWGSIIVPVQLPDEAAPEIRRMGRHPRMAQVLLCGNGLSKSFGHPIYHPIFKAAAELGLPVAIHMGGEALPDVLAQPTAGGPPATWSEFRVLTGHATMTHLASVIGEDVFGKYPDLKLIIVGNGLTWIPWLMWRFNNMFLSFGRETPWLKRLPADYFRDHVLVSTWPLERAPATPNLQRLLKSFDGMQRIACFASGFPDQETDSPEYVADRIPAEWAEAAFYGNAARVYAPRFGG